MLEEAIHDSSCVELLRGLGTRSAMAVPLVARDRTLGVISLGLSTSVRRYRDVDLPLAQELARRAALSLDNARLYRELQDAVHARDEFLSIAAHELRTPITSLLLVVQGLGRAAIGGSPAVMSRLRRVAERQARKLNDLINELFSASQDQANGFQLKLEEMDLADRVRSVVEGLEGELAQARCPLVLRADRPVVGRWDCERIDQLVTHLLANAIKFGAGKPIEVIVERSVGVARLRVSDQGIGIEPHRLAQIFGRFERGVSAREYGGFGLGLFIVQKIVSALGGSVRVESSAGKGSAFEIELPLEVQPALLGRDSRDVAR